MAVDATAIAETLPFAMSKGGAMTSDPVTRECQRMAGVALRVSAGVQLHTIWSEGSPSHPRHDTPSSASPCPIAPRLFVWTRRLLERTEMVISKKVLVQPGNPSCKETRL
jgi:hypothetical protein